MDRPRMSERQRSSSIIVPKGRDVVQKDKPLYPPDDARAMSPRRNSQDLEKLEQDVRQSLKEYVFHVTNPRSPLTDMQSSKDATIITRSIG